MAQVERRIALAFRDGRSDKVYAVELHQHGTDRFEVRGVYGRRNGSMSTASHFCAGLSEAEQRFGQIVKEKTAKGYREEGSAPSVQLPVSAGVPKLELPVDGPMLLNEVDPLTAAKLVTDEDWLMQPKWDGHRCLLVSQEGQVRGYSRVGNEKALSTEIVRAAKEWSQHHTSDFVVDGELIPSPDGERFICFDVLKVGDSESISLGASYRATFVTRMWAGSGVIQASATAFTKQEKEDMYRACLANGQEGVVLKRKSASYSPGRPNSGGDGLKLKFVNTCEVVCGGQRGMKRSVSMLLFDGTEVGSLTIPPNREIPNAGEVLSVRYLYRGSEEGHLVQAAYLGTRDDISPQACTAAQLRVKGAPRS